MTIPLILGLLIYLTAGSQTYISSFASKIGIAVKSIDYPGMIRAHGCDLLWGYSLSSGLQLFIKNGYGLPDLLKVITVASLVALAMESIQVFSFVSGTFDVKDIIVEFCAICAAALVTKIYTGRHQNEKRCTE